MKIGIKNLVKNGVTFKGCVNAITYDFDEEAKTPAPKWCGRSRLWAVGGGSVVNAPVEADTLEDLIDAAKATLP